MPQPLPPTEQGKPPQRQRSQPGGGEPRPPPTSAAPTRGQPLQTALMEGGPHTKRMGTPPPSSRQHPGRGIVPAMLFAGRRVQRGLACPGC